AYNEAHGIVPKTIIKDVRDVLEISSKTKDVDKNFRRMTRLEREQVIKQLTAEMRAAAKLLEFEHAAYLRDKIEKLKTMK
ncbi:MAG: UvrB/UvrC motif-containing protein, partial [Clostridia bacterium]|nr:UvrB/UvrC motif-containing protein [Clostridia bacterium]